MFDTFINSMAHYPKLLTGAASILAIFTFEVQASGNQDEVQRWLDQQPLPTTGSTPIDYGSTEFSTHFNSPLFALKTLNTTESNYHFSTSHKKVQKSNTRKLLRRLSDKLKISLFSNSTKNSYQLFYVNAAKQELVGKAKFGRARYELRVNEAQAEAHFRYAF